MRAQEMPAASKASRVSRMIASASRMRACTTPRRRGSGRGSRRCPATSTCGRRARPSASATAPAAGLPGAVQADVELDQQRGASRRARTERGGQALGGRDAVDGDRQLDAVRRDAAPAGRTSRRRTAGSARGCAARRPRAKTSASPVLATVRPPAPSSTWRMPDLRRLVRLGVRPERDAVLRRRRSAGARGWPPAGRGRPSRPASRRRAAAGRPARRAGGACARPLGSPCWSSDRCLSMRSFPGPLQ